MLSRLNGRSILAEVGLRMPALSTGLYGMLTVTAPLTGSTVILWVGLPELLVFMLTPCEGKVPLVYWVPLMVMLVALVGNEVILMESILPFDESTGANKEGETVILVVPPGFAWPDAVAATAKGLCSMPKLALPWLLVVKVTGSSPFVFPSFPAPAPRFSPVFTQVLGKLVAGAALLTVPWLVVTCTV